MGSLANIEFYNTPNGDVKIVGVDTPAQKYEPEFREFTDIFIETLMEFYPESYNTLYEHFKKSRANPNYHKYLIVHRFIRCNFGEYDRRSDIDHLGVFNFEEVKCPLRGECALQGVVCSPKFNNKLTERETEVMRLYCENKKEKEIGELLYVSPYTILKHKRNALAKLKLHSIKEFVIYAKNKNLFNDSL